MADKMSKLFIKGILELSDKLNNSSSVRYIINGCKNKKLNFAAFWLHGLGP